MKQLFYSFLTFVFVALTNIGSLNAQQVHAKIQEVYGDKTQELVINDPNRLAFLNDLLDNRITVVEMPVHEKENYTMLSSVPLLDKYNSNLKRDLVFDPNNFNPLKYSLKFSSSVTEVYRIDGTNYVIILKPQPFK